MVRTTPFHARLSELNTTGLWGHWAGYLSAQKYVMSAKHEYFTVRNAAGFFDTSPLYKYRVAGRDAERFLAGVLTRDVRQCRPGRAQYTVWCDDRGFVLEDGVVFRHSDNEFLLTAAEPNLGYLADLVGRLDVTVEDVTEAYGMLAVQGPRSRRILAALAPDVERLAYFEHCETKIGAAAVTISRTGYTGDLGYEIRVPADDALGVLDAVIEAGRGHQLKPFGEQALLMTRIEAGLVLIDVEFSSSRLAFTDHDRVTPKELGLGWMLKGLDADDRPFLGREAIRRELAEGTSRWASVGIVLDWADHDRVYQEAGLIPPKDETPLDYESMLYDDEGERVGYATSLMYSPVLQRHIAMARVRPELSAVGTHANLELTINHQYETVAAEVTRLPFFNPQRKTA
ncbi:MAG TPA: aminomethyltransferase family protein [Nocardioides sp.]|uniref:aminomethyltransferase family protein n=1 Tax=Nocardioides sp. TaxID=35761 RepID=UPI002C77E034|nr:aminomethyltransferase family protein [Nocardioides sp.]HQR26247.1 aminomethyltransferase family protein [Nocardioides sp.]